MEKFNNWAANPKVQLPSQFSYAEGELKLREKQKIKNVYTSDPAANDSAWITGKSGPTWYLFPNPNAIDELGGNVDDIYYVNGTRRAKGQNKIKIIEACTLKDENWIEYKGTLNLI
jgi:hypothetical protein